MTKKYMTKKKPRKIPVAESDGFWREKVYGKRISDREGPILDEE